MLGLESRIFFLMLFVAFTLQNKFNLTGKGVCLFPETYQEMVPTKVMKVKEITLTKKCWDVRKLFRCPYKTKELVPVWENRVVERTRLVSQCCPGFAHLTLDGNQSCEPICENECVNGRCTAPDTCTCDPGFQGYKCHKSITTTTTTDPPQTTSTTSSAGETSITTEQIFTSDFSQTTETNPVMQKDRTGTTIMEETTTININDGIGDEESTAFSGVQTEIAPNNAKTTTNSVPNLTETVTVSSKAVKEIKKDDLLQEECAKTESPETIDSTIPELKTETESPMTSTKSTWMDNLDYTSTSTQSELENVQVFDNRILHLTPGLYLFSAVCALLILIAAWWLIAHYHRKIKQKQTAFKPEGRVQFQAENVFLVYNTSEIPFRTTDSEMSDIKPVLKSFKPLKSNEEETIIIDFNKSLR